MNHMVRYAAGLVGLIAAGAVSAQNFAGAPSIGGSFYYQDGSNLQIQTVGSQSLLYNQYGLIGPSPKAVSTLGTEFIVAQCGPNNGTIYPTNCGTGSPTNAQVVALPLTDFASSADLSALRGSLSNLATAADVRSLSIIQAKASKVLSGGVAMASALDFQSPADGKSSRLGGGVADFNDQGALALTYTFRHDGWDAGLGIATSRYQNMAKASVGVSW